MRTHFILSLLAASGIASASYDLMLLGDNTTAGAQKVVRYDPVTGASLGSFGQGFFSSNIKSISADVNSGLCWVQSGSALYTFNYSTGEFVNVFSISSSYGDIHFDATSNSVTTGEGQGSGVSPARRYDAATGASLSIFSGAFISTAPLERSGSSLVYSYGLIGVSTIGVHAYNSSGGGAVATFDSTIPWIGGAVTPRQAVFVGTKLYGVFGDGSTYSRFYTMNTTPSGFTGGFTTTDFGTSFAGTTNIAAGHGGNIYLRCGNSLTIFSTNINSTLGTRTLPIGSATAVGGMAVIIAPEPSTWFGMAVGSVGFLAILRRKRRN